jgi:hypothetical protein
MNPVKHYVETKIAVTKCQQRNFKQLCSRCSEYAKCKSYAEYCNAWTILQAEVKDKDNG